MLLPSNFLFVIVLLGGVIPMAAQSQSPAWTRKGDDRPFALVYDSTPVSYNGVGAESERALKQYVAANPGRYLVFEDRGSLYRLDDGPSVAAAERQIAAMRPLEAREQALSGEQAPLQQRMRELSQKMNAAQSAEQQRSIGEEMSGLGDRMGKLGAEQGRIGNQIGAIANAFYQSSQAMFTKCLVDGSCRRI